MKKKTEKIDRFAKQYGGLKLNLRPGSMDFMKNPTRIANTLFYTDGTSGTYKDATKNNDNDKKK